MSDKAWRQAALCAQVGDADLWYPPSGSDAREAKRICRRCPVATDCLEEALATGDEWGIWGGTAGRTRRTIIHRRTETAA